MNKDQNQIPGEDGKDTRNEPVPPVISTDGEISRKRLFLWIKRSCGEKTLNGV